jgi:hypothetical protein
VEEIQMRSPWTLFPIATYFFIALVVLVAAGGTLAATG